jgi:hypothetical protein
VIIGVPRKALTVEGVTLASFKTASEDYQSTNGAAVLLGLWVADIQHDRWFEPTVEIWTRSAQPVGTAL